MNPELLTVYKTNLTKRRMGKEYDGGYIICDLDFKDQITKSYDCILAGGICDDISFEESFLNVFPETVCFAFDGTIKSLPKINNKINFIKKNINHFNDEKNTNLKEYINLYDNIFVKMDIEGYEINWIKDLKDDHLNKFSQIVIEFHSPYQERDIEVFEKLNKNHLLVHLHANNVCGTRIHKGIIMPNVFECTYVHKKFIDKNLIRLNSESIPTWMDMPNISTLPEIKLNHPPFVNKINVTVLGSCRQHSISKLHNVSSIQENLSYPHYTKEILEVIKFAKGCKSPNLTPEETLYTFRTPILNKNIVTNTIFKQEFENSDVFIIEIASKKYYKYNNIYIHHIAEDPYYNLPIIDKLEKGIQSDEEIEEDILEIKRLITKPINIVSHLVTRNSGERYNLSILLENICTKHKILFLNPVKELKKIGANLDELFVKENILSHYTERGHQIISTIYKDFINKV